MVSRCLQAADQLLRRGVRAEVIGIHAVKPLDTQLIARTAEKTRAIVTAEEHTVMGGFGSAVAEALAKIRPAAIEMVGLNDSFAETGPDPETLMDACGLSVADVVRAAERAIRRKGV
jgi:transketolase